MQDGDLHVETSNYGEVWSKAYFTWNAKGRFSEQGCQTLFILHTMGRDRVIEEHHYSDRTAFEK